MNAVLILKYTIINRTLARFIIPLGNFEPLFLVPKSKKNVALQVILV